MRALVLFALLAAGPAVAAPPSPEAASRKDRGDQRRDAGDATGALASYREALQISPDYVEAWEEIGKLYFGAKKFPEAADAFQRAVDIDGSYSNNWFNLALARRRAGDLQRSRDAFRRYLQLKPDDADGRLRLADVLRALDDREAAIREYQAVVAAADARTVAPTLGDRAKEAIAQLREGPAAAGTSPAAASPSPAPAAPTAALPTPVVVPATPVVPVTPPPAPSAPPPPAVTAPAPAPRPVAEVPAPPSPALLDKLALGDRLQTSGDYRGALFAFQDAVYLEPRNPTARVKLGRAYWALRYVGQAEEQWQQATQLAPSDPSIAYQIEEARKAPRPAITEPGNGSGGSPGSSGPPTASGGGAASRPPADGPRVYKFVPEGQGPDSPSAPPKIVEVPRDPGSSTPGYGLPPAQTGPSAPPQGQPGYGAPGYPPSSPSQPSYGQPAYGQPSGQAGHSQPAYDPSAYPPPQPLQAPVQPLYPAPPYEQRSYQAPYAPPAPPQLPSASAAAAAQRYRTALSLYIQRDYLGAIAELDAAITLDPNLSVAYTARGSSKFGLRKYREAAADYKAALDLDATKAEPIWGLAECQRMLADPGAVGSYRRYAASIAGDVNEDRRSKARRWATELSGQAR